MGKLQEMFEKEIQELFSFPVVGVKLIKKQLEKKGIFLNKKQIATLKKKLQNTRDSRLDFDFNKKQSRALGITNGEEIKIDISSSDEELDEIYQEVIATIKGSMPEVTREMSMSLLSDLKKNTPSMLKERREDLKKFETRLSRDWKKPFDLFETFLVIAIETGEEFNREFRSDESNKGNYVLEALTRLHARACQIASEILILLKSGYADGAHARWRSLHEIAVVGSFLKIHGNETAERYLLHDKIESFKAANLYQKYHEALKYDPMTQDEYDSIKDVHDELVTRFGNSYKNDYGWASSALKNNKPSFSNIEENSGLNHLRPYYKLASHNVHANPKGIMFKLGLLQNTPHILLTGPTNVGFTDPAQGAINSLAYITIALLTSEPTIDNLVASNILSKLQSEIGEEFFKVQKEIEKRDAAQRRIKKHLRKKQRKRIRNSNQLSVKKEAENFIQLFTIHNFP